MSVKHQILFVICLLLALTASAQELTIKGMQATNDLSASQYKRNDINEQPCALIKVQLATTGATFEGNVIKPVEYKSGEYWVYMPGGNKELMIKHPSFLPLHINFADHGIKSVQSLVTYRLTLLMPQTSAPIQTQKLTISYTPANAIVVVDSKTYTGNGQVELILPVGPHDYQIVAPGYDSAEGSVKLIASQPRTITEHLAAATQPTTVQQPTPQPVKQQEPVEQNTLDAIDSQRRRGILKYLEDFRSYFEEKNIKALRDIFSDDALIISGIVLQRSQGADQEVSKKPEIRYTKKNKEQYISNMGKVFKRKDSITVDFDDVKIEHHPTKTNFYGVTFHQKWSSRYYSDSGYMFMLWEFEEGRQPVIHVRTWQPEMVGNRKLTEDEIFKMKDFPIQ